MKLDLTEIMNKRRESLDFEYELDASGSDDFALLPDGEAFSSPVHVRVHAFDANSYIRLDITAGCELVCQCTRCLGEVRVPLEVSFRRYAGQSVEYDDDGGEDVLEVNDSAVCPDADIMEEISLNAPEIVLCDENCPGLCQQCGKKIGAGCTCGSGEEKKTSDPRLDVFRKLLLSMEDEE